MKSDKTTENKSPKPHKPYDRNEGKNWYQKLMLSQKFQINAVIGLILVAVGAVVLTNTGAEMLHHWEYAIHGGVGVVALIAGLWFFSRGLRYESQLDAIRIMKRNRNFSGGGNRKGPRKPAPKKG